MPQQAPSVAAATENIPVINVWSGNAGDPAAAVVNEYSVLSIPAFWCGVRFLSETLGSMPKGIYQRTTTSHQFIAHPLNKLLRRKANGFGTIPFTVFEVWHSHAVVHGNGYMWVERDKNTQAPIGLHNLSPGAVTPFRFNGAQWYFIRAGGPKGIILNSADVLHLPGLGFDGMVGFPVVWLMYEALELARNSQRFASRYLRKGTQVQGSVEIPNGVSPEKVQAILSRIRQSHNGIDGQDAGNFLVLSDGAVLKNATIPPEQSQLLQSRVFAVVDMCRILRVPPHIVYDLGKATWSNLEQMGRDVVTYSLGPWVEKAQQEASGKLLTEAEQDADKCVGYNLDSLTRGDTQTQTTTTLANVNGGLWTVNEGRRALGYPPINDAAADKLRVPVNFPVAAAVADDKTKKPAKAKADPEEEDDDGFAALKPIVEDAAARVEAKTAKAFAGRENKAPADRTIWANVFAEQQGRYIAEAFAPVDQVLRSNGITLDLQRIGQQYAAAVRSKAAGTEPKTLMQIIQEHRS